MIREYKKIVFFLVIICVLFFVSCDSGKQIGLPYENEEATAVYREETTDIESDEEKYRLTLYIINKNKLAL